MSIEYHGWIVLAASQDNWSDADFENGVARVRQILQTLRPEDGHDPAMPDPEILPHTVFLKGVGVDTSSPVLRVLEEIGTVFDKAYGALTIFDDRGDQNRWWSFRCATDYRLVDGTLKQKESEQ